MGYRAGWLSSWSRIRRPPARSTWPRRAPGGIARWWRGGDRSRDAGARSRRNRPVNRFREAQRQKRIVLLDDGDAPSGLRIAVDGGRGRVFHALANATGSRQHKGQLARRGAGFGKFGLDLGE